jgi:hypothetical protein
MVAKKWSAFLKGKRDKRHSIFFTIIAMLNAV